MEKARNSQKCLIPLYIVGWVIITIILVDQTLRVYAVSIVGCQEDKQPIYPKDLKSHS